MAENGIEVASTYVTVLAKAPGLSASIGKALGGVDVSPAAKKIGQQVAESVGKSLKDQVAKKLADATAAALDKSTAATKRLEQAEHNLRKARAQHGDAKAKVTGAEEKLAKLRDQAAKHSASVADAEAKLEKLRESGEASAAKIQKAEADLNKLRESGKVSTADLEKAEADLAKAQTNQAGTSRGVASEQNRVAEAKRNAADATKGYTDALAREQSKSEQALAWMPLANARIDEISAKWRTAGEKISGVGDQLTNNITKPVVVATGAVGTLVGALGFKRLVGIDTARGQFQGLGLDADAVMKQVDAGVTNTALSMADGAALAVGILATGNLPLTQLEEQLKRVANVSAAYGVDSSHAGYLLNNVLTKNKVTYGDLSQMVQNNIPIISSLADYYGVAGDAIEGMAQRGEISIEDFNTVLDQNAGAAAEAYAGTWKGVTSNILSNLGKIGAKFLEPTFNIMKEEAAGFLEMLRSDEFSTVAAELGDRIGQVIRDVSAGIQSLIGWWAGLSDGQKKFIGVSALVLVAMGPVLKIVGSLFIGISKMIGVGKVIVGLFTGWKVAAGGAAIGSKALTGATAAQTGAMNAAAVAQKLLNAAIWKSPITWIVAGIIALVAGLVHFFKNTETGKAIWAEFTRFLGEAWANISQFFQDTWNNVLKPIFEGIGQVFAFVWNSILKPVFDAIVSVAQWVFNTILLPIFTVVQFAFAVLGGIFQGIWESILKPVFDAIGAVFKWLWDTIISIIIAYIVIQVKVWGAIFTWLWNSVLKPTFDAIGKVFQWIWNSIIMPIVNHIKLAIQGWGIIFQWLWTNVLQPVFKFIGDIFSWVWNTVISPIVTWIQEKIAVLGLAFRIMYEQYIKPAWDSVASVISNVWNTVKGVIDTMVRVVQTDPKRAFEAARDAIGDAWSGIQELAKKPVRFVIETVINGLINTINKIPGVDIPNVPLPKGFRVGGYTGDVGVNTAAGVVHGREFVTRADSTAKIMRNHPGVLEYMNRHGEIPGYRKGGLVNPLPMGSYSVSQPYHGGHNGIDLAAAAGTKVYAAADGVVGLAGVVPMGGNEVYVQHTNGLGTRYSHLSRFATSPGTQVKAGNVIGYVGSTGMSTGPHLHYMVHAPGGGAGNYGNHVNPAPYLGIAGKDLGEAGGAQSILDGLVDFAASKVKGAFPEGGMWIDIAAGLAKNAAETMAKVFNPFAASDGHTLLYDNGGWLQPGRHLVENKSGRPEPILTASQWDGLLAGGGRGDVYVQNPFTGDYLLAQVDDRADSAVDRGFEDRAAAGRFASYV